MRARTLKALTLLAALLVPPLLVSSAIADGAQKFEIRFAGGFIQNIQQMQVDMMGIPTGVLESRGLVLGKGADVVCQVGKRKFARLIIE